MVDSENKEINNKEELNNLNDALEKAGVSSRILAIYLNAHKGTISNWKTNSTQPNLSDIDKIAELLEIDNQNLVAKKERVQTGLAKAVVDEYKRLMKIEKLELYVTLKNEKTGQSRKVFNPKLVEKIQEFVAAYKVKYNKK